MSPRTLGSAGYPARLGGPPGREIDPAWRSTNAALTREPRVLVGVRATAGDYAGLWSLGAYPGAAPLVVSISGLPQRWEASSLTLTIGEIEIAISTAMPYTGPPIQAMAELLGFGSRAPRWLDVLAGFAGLPQSAFLSLFLGRLVEVARLGVGSYSLVATDGSELVRRVDPATLALPDLWRAVPSLVMDFPTKLALDATNALLTAASGDANEVIPDSDYVLGGIGGWNQTLWQQVDYDLMYTELARHVLGEQDPREALYRAVWPIFRAYVARDVASRNRLVEFRALDKKWNDLPSHRSDIELAIDDGMIVEPPTTRMLSESSRVRSVTIRYGRCVWDEVADLIEANPGAWFVGQWKRIDYESDQLHEYLFEHRVRALPALGSGADVLDGVDVTIDAPLVLPTEATVWEEDVYRDNAPLPTVGDRPYPPLDSYGFPGLYRYERRSWQGTTWSLVPAYFEAAKLGLGAPRRLHEAGYGMLRAWWLQPAETRLVLQARAAATLSVGSTVSISSAWMADPEHRQLGTIEYPIIGQVVEREIDPAAGTVTVSVAHGVAQPLDRGAELHHYEEQLTHTTSWVDKIVAYLSPDHGDQAWTPVLSYQMSMPPANVLVYDSGLDTPSETISRGAWHRLRRNDGDGWDPRTWTRDGGEPRATPTEGYDERFSRVSYSLSFHIKVPSAPRQQWTMFYRVSLLSLPDDEGDRRVIYSIVRRYGCVLDYNGEHHSGSLEDTIYASGCKALRRRSRPSVMVVGSHDRWQVPFGQVQNIWRDPEGKWWENVLVASRGGVPDENFNFLHADLHTVENGIGVPDELYIPPPRLYNNSVIAGNQSSHRFTIERVLDATRIMISENTPFDKSWDEHLVAFRVLRAGEDVLDPTAGVDRDYLFHRDERIGSETIPGIECIKVDLEQCCPWDSGRTYSDIDPYETKVQLEVVSFIRDAFLVARS